MCSQDEKWELTERNEIIIVFDLRTYYYYIANSYLCYGNNKSMSNSTTPADPRHSAPLHSTSFQFRHKFQENLLLRKEGKETSLWIYLDQTTLTSSPEHE